MRARSTWNNRCQRSDEVVACRQSRSNLGGKSRPGGSLFEAVLDLCPGKHMSSKGGQSRSIRVEVGNRWLMPLE